MGWFIALAIIVLLAILPLGASVKYDSGGVLLRLIAGPIRITLFPVKMKEKPNKKTGSKENKAESADANPEKTAESKISQPQQQKDAEKSGGKLTDFLPLVQVALDFLGDLRRKLRVDVLELKLIMAGDDPCDLATNYGRAWTALGNLWPQLERLFVIKKRDVNVECDFTADETLIYARLDLTITLGRLLALVVCYSIRALKEFLKIMRSRKGGNVS